MIHLKRVFLVGSILTCTACNLINPAPKLTVQVTNNAPKQIDFLTVATVNGQEKQLRHAINSGETTSLELNFARVEKTDGSYQVSYKFANSADTLTRRIGYYTNGAPIEKALLLTVYADSLSVGSIPKRSY